MPSDDWQSDLWHKQWYIYMSNGIDHDDQQNQVGQKIVNEQMLLFNRSLDLCSTDKKVI